jgi:hypothetical protein
MTLTKRPILNTTPDIGRINFIIYLLDKCENNCRRRGRRNILPQRVEKIAQEIR